MLITLLFTFAIASATLTTDALDAWLYATVLHIPNQTISAGDLTITIGNIACSHIAFSAFDTTLTAPPRPATPTNAAAVLKIALGVASLECTSFYNYTLDILGLKTHGAGPLSFALAPSTAAFDVVALRNVSDGVPNGAALSNIHNSFHIAWFNVSDVRLSAGVLTAILSAVAESVVKSAAVHLVTDVLDPLLVAMHTACVPLLVTPTPAAIPPVPAGAVPDLRQLPLTMLLDDVLNHALLPAIDELVDLLLPGGVLALTIPTHPVSNTTPGLEVQAGLHSLTVRGLDTWRDTLLLAPAGPSTLNASFSLANFGLALDYYLVVHDLVDPVGHPMLNESGRLLAGINATQLFSTTAVFLNASVLAVSPVCVGHALEGLDITWLELAMNLTDFAIDGAEPGTLEAGLEAAVTNLAGLVWRSFSPAALSAVWTGLIAGPGREALNRALSRRISVAAAAANSSSCKPAPAAYHDANLDRSIELWFSSFTGAAVVAALLIAVGVARCQKKRARAAKITGPSKGPLVAAGDAAPWPIRYGALLLIGLSIAGFIVTDANAIAFAELTLHLGGVEIAMVIIQKLKFLTVLKEFWDAKVYGMVLLMAVGGFIFPYVRLLGLLSVWLSPRQLMGARWRERFLVLWDSSGKLAFAQIFLAALLGTAIRYHLYDPGQDALRGAVADIALIPSLALSVMVIAIVLSLVASHIMLWAHRRNVYGRTSKLESTSLAGVQTVRLGTAKMHVAGLRCGPSRVRAALVALLLLLAGGLSCWGAAVTCLKFTYLGAAGKMLVLTNETFVKEFSLFSLCNPTDHPPIASQVVLKTTLAVGFVIPLLHYVLLLALWMLSANRRMLRRLFVATEMCAGWASQEVLVLSLGTAVWQLREFVAFTFAAQCAQINPLLRKFFNHALDGDDVCMDVAVTAGPGLWILSVACLCGLAARAVVAHVGYQVLFDPAKRGDQSALARESYAQGMKTPGLLQTQDDDNDDTS